MQYVLMVVEQLDRAIHELSTDHPINNRLALILIDNGTELVLHRRCMDHLFSDRMLRSLQPKQRRMAKSQFLRDKLKVLEQLDDITRTERRFIQVAHSYRNALYHAGLKHDDIIRAIAGHYFLLCCDLFAQLKPSSVSQSSTDRYTAVAERYLPIRDGPFAALRRGSQALVEELAEKLRSARPKQIPDLTKTLANSARTAIQQIEAALEFSVRENPSNLSSKEVLELAQLELEFRNALEREGVSSYIVDPLYQDAVSQVTNTVEATWRPRHTSLPSENWASRADAIEGEVDPLIAMDLYQSLRNDMSYLEDAISFVAAELDRWQQLQDDIARGK